MEDNVYDILKNAPKGLPLYSPMIGECELCDVSPTRVIIVKGFEINEEFVFNADGKYRHVGECMLFPAKGVGWDKWQCALIAPGDIVEAAGTVYSVTKREPRGDCDVTFEVCDQNGRRTVASYESLSYSDEDECIAYVTVLGKNGYSYDGKGGVSKPKESESIIAGMHYVCVKAPECGTTAYRFSVGSSYASPKTGYLTDDDGADVYFEDTNGFFREWTIRDAVRGDVLAAGDVVFMYSGEILNGDRAGTLYCLDDGCFIFGENASCWSVSDVRPASDGEIFAFRGAMCENGCMWNPVAGEAVELQRGDVVRIKPAEPSSGDAWRCTVRMHGRDGFVVDLEDGSSRKIGCVQCVKAEVFDPSSMRPFDRVLVRNSPFLEWEIALFGRIASREGIGFVYVCAGGEAYNECMPFNEYTECYLGKSGEYNGMYRKW